MNKLLKKEPMHARPEGNKEVFWDAKLDKEYAQDDLYLGKGATYTPYQCSYPYSIVEITGQLGNRIAKLRECDFDGDDYFDRPNPVVQEWDSNDGFIYIKEKDLSMKRKSGISYNKVYVKNLDTNRLRVTGGSLFVGKRIRHSPREI